MDDLQFYVLFNNISVISGRWADDTEGLCAMKPRLRSRRFRLQRGLNSGRLDQGASAKITELPVLLLFCKLCFNISIIVLTLGDNACPNGELLRNPDECWSYLQCMHGALVRMPCPPGLVFSVVANTCVRQGESMDDCTTGG